MIELESWPIAGAPTAGALAVLAEPCARVARDMLVDAQIATELGDLEWWVGHDSGHPAPTSWTTMGLKVEGEIRFGAGVNLDTDLPTLTSRVAELVQDHLTGYEFIQWPSCSGHRHLMVPAVRGPEAWWICKESNGPKARIGDLGAYG